MLRNNPIGSVLLSFFFVLSLIACWLSVRYYFSVKEFQGIQVRIQAIEGTMANMQRLVNETIEYSKRSPDLDPVLLKYRLKAPPQAPTAPPAAAAPPASGARSTR